MKTINVMMLMQGNYCLMKKYEIMERKVVKVEENFVEIKLLRKIEK